MGLCCSNTKLLSRSTFLALLVPLFCIYSITSLRSLNLRASHLLQLLLRTILYSCYTISLFPLSDNFVFSLLFFLSSSISLYCQWAKLTADQPSMAKHPYSSRCAFNTAQRTFSSSKMNFYYVFYLILISMIFFLCFCDGGVGGGVLNISLVVDPRIILSKDNT